ncbi:MAG: apolipoprotein N-acyltransferase [Candidatus Sulfotelmatobacter sp.]
MAYLLRTLGAKELWIGLALSTLSGCLWFLSCTPFGFSALSWVAMVPALFVVDRASTRLGASLSCWWAGTVMVGGGFYWLIETMRRFANLSLPVALLLYVLFCAYQGSVFLLFGWLVRTIRRRTSCPMALLAPLAMVTSELFVPLLFPSHLAIMQAWHPLVIQIADLTGPMGVTALLLMVSGAAYDLLTRRRRGLAPAMASAVILVAALLYGKFRMQHFDALSAAGPKLKIGLVQPNVAYNQKGLEHPEQAGSQLAALQEQSRELEKGGAQLIVWSETGYPYSLPRDFQEDFPESSNQRIRRGFTTPIVVGALTFSSTDSTLYNSALLIDREGRAAGRYDKMLLLAFGERVPGEKHFPWLRKFVPQGFGSFTPGKEVSVLPLRTADGSAWRLGTIICYEDILPGLLRRVGALQPHLLVNLTNDTWFGARAEPLQHLALAVFGSVEQRTGMVRAVNSGVSAFLDANGRVTQKTHAVDPYFNPRSAESSMATLPLLEGGHTIYAKVGDLFAYLCALVTASLLVRAMFSR